VYIGRRGIVFVNSVRYPPQESKWCNPYKISKKMTRASSLIAYRKHLRTFLRDPDNLREFQSLKGKTLECWCAPEACHGDVIVELLDSM
jgi:hypothetical protein